MMSILVLLLVRRGYYLVNCLEINIIYLYFVVNIVHSVYHIKAMSRI